MGFFTSFTSYAAPIFLISSPILSYADQAMSMHRRRSSAGFSLDIPLIMLVASIFRVFYYPGARYDVALLIQSFCNIFMQAVLLKIALDTRPAPSSRGGEAALPFSGLQLTRDDSYWQFLLYMFITLTVLELMLAPFRQFYPTYSSLLGVIGLSVEATLPLPQLYANAQSRSCKGFRLSVLVSWLIGDTMKMFWFFTSQTQIPLAFKVCGIFQAGCDAMLGVQYLMYGEGEAPIYHRPQQMWPYAGVKPHLSPRLPSGRNTPSGRRSPFGEKAF